MDDDAAKVRKLRRQRAAIAGFGSFALRQNDLPKILTEAARVCAEGLDVPFSKVCRYRAAENDFFIEAGYGWQPGVIGHVVSRADLSSPQAAFAARLPSICSDLREDNGFRLPPSYAAYDIVSTIDVLIDGADQPYGVLEIGNDEPYDYDQHDIDFLTGFANILAEAIAASARTALLQTAVGRMKASVKEKDRLLDQKQVLGEALQHRVRNNLQLVYGMVSQQLDDTDSKLGKRGLKAIARRVSTLAQVYDHLLGDDMTPSTDFGGYVKSLCLNLAELQTTADRAITLTCHTEPIFLDIDIVTALGIVIAELVTNSYDHAFPSGRGAAVVSVGRDGGDPRMATMTISDDGKGFAIKAEGKRRGLRLVRRLIEQVRGTSSVDSANGTVWTIRFPVSQRLPAAAMELASS